MLKNTIWNSREAAPSFLTSITLQNLKLQNPTHSIVDIITLAAVSVCFADGLSVDK